MRPVLHQTVLDAPDARISAEPYRELPGWDHRTGDEAPAPREPGPRATDRLVLHAPGRGVAVAFQQVDSLTPSTWPSEEIPRQLRLDLTVATSTDLGACHQRALSLGARVVLDRTDDPDEPLWVCADTARHPSCILLGV